MSSFLVGAGSFDLGMRVLIDVCFSTQPGSGIRLQATDFSLDVGWSARIRLNFRFVQSGRSERFLIAADGHVFFRRTRVVTTASDVSRDGRRSVNASSR